MLRTKRDLYCTAFGVALGVMQLLAFMLGVTQILAFLDTNTLVSPLQNSRVRGIAQRDSPTRLFLRRSGM